MKTVINKINADNPTNAQDLAAIRQAAEIIKNGGLVAFPTETVYGLGANALDSSAVKKIYAAKNRPPDNPLIVHIAARGDLDKIAASVPEKAEALFAAFWPGPLTVILSKKETIPYETSGGLDTVAVRLPENKTARLLIQEAGVPIAAPSANASGKPSPTRASHVEFDLDGKIDMILDGGATVYGLESTVIDMTGETPRILRPGVITMEMIQKVIGFTETSQSESLLTEPIEKPVSPGMKYRHYSPLAKLYIVEGQIDSVVERINNLVQNSTAVKVGILASEQTAMKYPAGTVLNVGDRNEPKTIAANLFKMLRKFDYLGVTEIYSENFAETQIGAAVMNRLNKAAGDCVIKCNL